MRAWLPSGRWRSPSWERSVWRAGLGGSGGVARARHLRRLRRRGDLGGMRMVELAVRTAAETRGGRGGARPPRGTAAGLGGPSGGPGPRRGPLRAHRPRPARPARHRLARAPGDGQAGRGQGRRRKGDSGTSRERRPARLSDMVGDLLVVSRLEKGLRAERASVPVRAFVEGVARRRRGAGARGLGAALLGGARRDGRGGRAAPRAPARQPARRTPSGTSGPGTRWRSRRRSRAACCASRCGTAGHRCRSGSPGTSSTRTSRWRGDGTTPGSGSTCAASSPRPTAGGSRSCRARAGTSRSRPSCPSRPCP